MSRAVAVAVSLPRLELDRPFTYLVPEGLNAPLGSLVSVRFHGRTVHGYSLGKTRDVPARVLPISRVLSKRPLFDLRGLHLATGLADRYVVPLAVALAALHPPRVASEEHAAAPPVEAPVPDAPGVLAGYEGGPGLLEAARRGEGAFVLRPLPDEEAATCLEAVGACVAGGRGAIVVVPELDPLPATARAVLDAFGDAAVLFAGGDKRARYRTWLDILDGRFRVVVGTPPASLALVPRLGLLWIHRDAHAAHREERSPRYHPREVAALRRRLEKAVCVLAGLAPSAAAAAAVDAGTMDLIRPPRARERAAAPLVETASPEAEDRSPRLTALLRAARGAVLLLTRAGFGIARVCRRCAEPARCGACGGPIVLRGGQAACAVCATEGRCVACGAVDFGIERGGTERIAQWAAGLTTLPVEEVQEGARAVAPSVDQVVVGTAAAVKDFGARRTGLVAILDADRARRRPGLDAPEQTVATWMEAAAWAGGRGGGGRVLVHTRDPGDPAVQGLVRWDPMHFHRRERRRRVEAGFPPGYPVFRVTGGAEVEQALRDADPVHLLTTPAGDETLCLVTVRPEEISRFRERILELVAGGVVSRVESEPQL